MKINKFVGKEYQKGCIFLSNFDIVFPQRSLKIILKHIYTPEKIFTVEYTTRKLHLERERKFTTG